MAVFHIAADYGSTDPLRRTARLVPRIWTCPAKAKKGDLAVLYSTTHQGWMAIGRIVHEPVRSRRDHKWWSYFQWLPIQHPLAYDDARRQAELRSWRKLGQMAGRHAEIKPPEVADFLLGRLSQRDVQARPRLRVWRSSRARFPDVDERDLLDAWFEPSAPFVRLPDAHERWLADEITEVLVKRRQARRRTDSDGLYIGHKDVVHLLTEQQEARFPDVVLVDRTRDRTLLLIEVKRHARLSDLRGLRDVVDQIIEYQSLIRALDRTWKVRPVIVAETVNDNVVERARDAAVEVWRYDRRTKRFRALAGTYG